MDDELRRCTEGALWHLTETGDRAGGTPWGSFLKGKDV